MSDFTNYSCDNGQSVQWNMRKSNLEYVLKLTLILVVSMLIIVLNMTIILTLHNKQYSCHLRDLPKILMTSLSLTDLSMGLLVTPVCFTSLAKGCFPFGHQMCKLQALLISSLFHTSSLLLISIAIDRYICIHHPLRYRSIMTKRVHYGMSVCSLLYSFVVYAILIFPNSKFTFDSTGLFNCEPFYFRDQTIIIIAFALFYIPSILVTVYCYTAIFLVAHRHMRQAKINQMELNFTTFVNNRIIRQRKKLYSSLIILSAISVGFIIAISPWTMVEFLTSVYQIKFGHNVEFITTWIAISNSFWNPIFYGLLNKHFRTSLYHFVCKCARMCSYQNTTIK